ncbi:MAG: substrate-binding domain-containing protein [Euryarchaeota archaeon]|nr:substrate-binding domain-containing protein [Euryarchaeota archaeon]
MEKKNMYIAVGIVAILIVAAFVGLTMNNSSDDNAQTVKIISLKKTDSSVAYSPLDQAAVYDGNYSLSRYLYLYTDGVPAEGTSLYLWLNLVLNETGQQLVENAGFYSLQPSDLAEMKSMLATGNNTDVTGDFKESGSTTMAEIATLWAAEFEKDTDYTVTLSTPGSGAGIKSFYQGEVEVAQASRAMTDAEKVLAIEKGVNPVEWKVAVDGIAIIVNEDNPVDTLTLTQLEGIFNGTITNWNQVGGDDLAISLYGRDSASGSYASFKDMVLRQKEDYASSMLQFNSNALIIPEVENSAGGVGYVGIGYAKEASGSSAELTETSYVSNIAMVSKN